MLEKIFIDKDISLAQTMPSFFYMKSEYFGLDKNMILSIFSLAIVILWIRVGLPKYEAKS